MRAARWALARLGSAVLVVWVVTTVVFFALRASGDPLEAILGGPGSQASEEAVARARETYGLDAPLIWQYVLLLGRTATLQLGDSYARRQPVIDLIAAQLPSTLLLASLALLLAWAPIGLILPVITLAVPIAGFLAQVMRDSLAEADAAPFAVTARSRGASETRVLLRHTLRHASLPALALSGWAYGSLLSGAVVVETLFARPGLGRLLIDGAMQRDVPLVIGAVVVVALVYVAVMVVVDALELVVDPRLRTRRRSASAPVDVAVGS
ncbi:MAG: transporter permease [Microbacterium sp.]|nr:transporter permease [Microbacterium sp.]